MTKEKSGLFGGLRALFAGAAQPRLRLLTLLARAALLVERLAAALAPAAIVAAFFVALSWTGVWLGAPVYLRIIGTAALLVALVLSLSRARKFSFPTAGEARAALDGADPDAPAAALSDALANDGDPQTRTLWRLHLRRAEKIAARLRPVAPEPRLWALDPYALGALAVLALCVGAFLAGPQKYARLAAAFDWRWRMAANEPSRIDAWIDPPDYTGRPPIVLALNEPTEKAAAIAAPVGSSIVVRAADSIDLRVAAQGGVEPAPDGAGAAALKERRLILRGDGSLRISRGATEIAQFSLRSLPDAPPTVTPLEAPQANLRGTFVLAYRIGDDYGARDAGVAARLNADAPPPLGHALVAPPSGPLDLPAAPGGLGDGRSTLDWTDSPYAGAPVDLVLSVQDEGGNEGQAVLRGFVLPKKNLVNPLALALAEQRRLLALDSAQKDKVLSALDAMMVAPEIFTPKPGVYLGLRYAHTALRHARRDDELLGVADFLWEMALRLEEGDAPQAERDLRAAQKALRDALNRGAKPEEIARLTQQLQKALDAFLAEMAKKSSTQARSGETESGDGRSVTAKDFKSMLDQLAEAAKDGDKEAAMDLLDRMQDMLENLRRAEKSGQGGKAANNNRTMRDLDKMMREQQKLRDDTYAHEQAEPAESGLEPPKGLQPPADGKGRRSGRGKPGAMSGARDPDRGQGEGQAAGEPGEDGSDVADADPLDQRQGRLREKLDSVQRRAKSSGATAPKGLDEAEEAMRQAEQSLRQGDDAAAVEAQGRAMDGLRKSAGELAKQAQQGDGEPGEDEGQAGKDGLRGQNGEGPFGHANRRDNVDATGARKARKVLEELRRRLSDPSRAREELDYLERLIKPD
ncbi:TIGR02302 family protein [uncultured Rhodoblastus sp.]|uniref:TIGR02302 family protein n=1 Tax=uncultured Rhodoblastus sp. TaxID=543037 RepID=UPI0025DA22BB|nr:TIGR02302 family protein [uncultured Rhodoblastus sp.]